jgi:hypothetical protein
MRAVTDKDAHELVENNIADAVAPSGRGPHDRGMDERRLAKLEGSYDALKVVRPMTITVIGVFLAALVFVLGFFATQISSINNKLDAIPVRLSEEFRALRAEMSAQTSAIANSITATKQAQPQIFVLPEPAPTPQPPSPQVGPAPREPPKP